MMDSKRGLLLKDEARQSKKDYLMTFRFIHSVEILLHAGPTMQDVRGVSALQRRSF
jgi:hypothetical protein